jgi:hypothetical protein
MSKCLDSWSVSRPRKKSHTFLAVCILKAKILKAAYSFCRQDELMENQDLILIGKIW